MLKQARAFLNSLEKDLQEQALFAFDASERSNWNYMPVPRQGIPLRVLSRALRDTALALLETSLSRQGYTKATEIMVLESILGELEGRPPEDRIRDPNGYFLTFYGTLAPGAVWGWRIDGHHLSLNFTSVVDDVATTPAFLGANPAKVPYGPRHGWRVLSAEEDLARRLLHAFDPQRKGRVMIAETAPPDIITGTQRDLDLDEPAGLAYAEMVEQQQALLMELVGVYVRNQRDDLAEVQFKRIRSAGIERLHFAWAGGLLRGEGHYYRIQGPTLLIEYDNTQNNANHIHTVMRDPERDFGRDLLQRHYAECRHDHAQ